MADPLDLLLEQLREGPFPSALRALCGLSGLTAEEAERVQAVWGQLPTERRRYLTQTLCEIAEADFEVDFGAVFRIGMEDEDAQVRAASVEGLWEDDDVRLVPRLAARLREDPDTAVRAAAATSLGRFILLGELEKIRPQPRAWAYEALLTASRAPDEELEVRRRALESLAYVSDEAVVGLIEEAYTAPQEKMRVSAVFAMGRSADLRWARLVELELNNPNPEMRYEAARACGELGYADAVPTLVELTDDVDPEVQEAALWALGQIGGDQARRVLEQYCSADDEALRAAARAALEQLQFLHGELDLLFGALDEAMPKAARR